MHKFSMPPQVLERVIKRRGKRHAYDALTPKKTALLVIDLQNAFMLPGVAHALCDAAKGIVPTTTQQGTGQYNVFGLTAGYSIGKFSFRAGIDNLLDEDPPNLNFIPGGDSNTDQTNASFYDILGRRFFIGVKASL